MKGMLWRVLALTAVTFGTACAGAFANEYYDVGSNYALYLAWTQDGSGHLQGQVEIIGMDSSNSTQLQTKNAAFSGTRNGSDVSLTFGMLTAFGGTTWTGHIGWGTLTLMIPTNSGMQRFTLHSGSFDQFQAAVSRIQGSVTQNQTRLAMYNAMNEASNHVSDGMQSINSGLARLRAMFTPSPTGGLRAKYSNEWQKMQAAWSKEQKDAQVAPMTCYQKSQVTYDASGVNYELSEFTYLDSEVTSAKWDYDSAYNSVRNGISELLQWAPTFDTRARTYSGMMGQSYSHSATLATGPTIASARKSLQIFNDKWASFKTYVYGYDTRAKQLNEKAQAFPESIACSG